MNIFFITFVFFLLFVAAMAVGVIFSNRKIKGSCGGLNNVDGLEGDCLLCSNKKCDKKKIIDNNAV
ncbi:MAG: (Na+)-NQR maturation NqrM [Cycloclasticus sp.]|nr:(Na+)-NQR maturation NqrM [Cycloclasticus sp.]